MDEFSPDFVQMGSQLPDFVRMNRTIANRIRASDRQRDLFSGKVSVYTAQMGEKEQHHSLNLLIAKAQRERCCMRPFWDTDIKVVARRVKQGSIVRVHRGLYAVKEYWEQLDPHEQIRHIMRSLGRWHEQWMFCGASAAIMHGLECSYRQLRPIHVAVGKSRRAKNQATIRYHALSDPDAVIIDGVKVTSIQRTLVDCASTMPFRYALAPIDAALRQGRIGKESLLAYVDSLPMLRDRERVRSIIALGDDTSENGGESECRAVLQEMGFPVHRLQVEFPCRSHPGRVHRVDFLWVREDGTLIAGEFDGVRKFVDPSMTSGRTIRQVVDDERDRQECLKGSGVDMVRMYYSDLDDPWTLSRRLEAALVPRRRRGK